MRTPFVGVIVFINFSTVVGAVVSRSVSLNSTISAPTILNSLSDTMKYSDPSNALESIVLLTLDSENPSCRPTCASRHLEKVPES